MARLIDADRLKEKMVTTLEVLKHIFPPGEQEVHLISAFATVGEMVDDCPTIDAVPVVHGEWIEVNDAIITGTCSVCGWQAFFAETDVSGMPYCPNCGAKMDGGKDDADE